MMNEAVVTLMLITASGFQPGPSYDTFEECEAVSGEIKQFETFCHYQKPIDIDKITQQLSQFMNEMKKQLDETKEENNKQAVPTI